MFYMQAMHVFGTKRDIEYCCLDGGQITDVAVKENHNHTVAFGVTTRCTEHVG
jgi:recombinational DNA repair protein (RecF pathway)